MRSRRKTESVMIRVLLIVALATQARADSFSTNIEETAKRNGVSVEDSITSRLVGDLITYLSTEYVELDVPWDRFDRLGRILKSRLGARDYRAFFHYMKSKHGKDVAGYECKLYGRIGIAAFYAESESIRDTIWNSVLHTMGVNTPLADSLTEAVKSPPTLLIQTSSEVIVITIRCEDVIETDGTRNETRFWKMVEDIVTLANRLAPELILGCGCGGPLRELGSP